MKIERERERKEEKRKAKEVNSRTSHRRAYEKVANKDFPQTQTPNSHFTWAFIHFLKGVMGESLPPSSV